MAMLNFSVTIKAPAKWVYEALTSNGALQDWFCDEAAVSARPDGYFFAGWNKGYHASGTFITLEEHQNISLKLRGGDETVVGQIDMTLREADGSTQVRVVHNASSEAWQRIWQRGLENLQSYLETGYDLRITRRPMVGIAPTELDTELAAKIGVPISKGIVINRLVPNMSAEAAGMQVNDVIIELDGKPITDYVSLPIAVDEHQAGDVVDLVYYRGTEKRSIKMPFAQRPVEPVPSTAEELASTTEKMYAELEAQLSSLFAGVSEDKASSRPEPKEWSAKEVVAHLIIAQDLVFIAFINKIEGEEFTGFSSNNLQSVEAVTSTYGTTAALLAELKRARVESIAMIRALPAEFVAKRGAFGSAIANCSWVRDHDLGHFDQIKRALESARVPVMAAED